jgi:hypothetical protein
MMTSQDEGCLFDLGGCCPINWRSLPRSLSSDSVIEDEFLPHSVNLQVKHARCLAGRSNRHLEAKVGVN